MPAESPVRVRLRYPDLDTFVEKFAPNVTRGGVFLASKEMRPVGSLLRFEVCLLDGQIALSGEGKVTWTKPFNPGEPHKPYGLGVQFTSLDARARPVLDRLLARRAGTGARPAGPAPTASTTGTGSGPVAVRPLDARLPIDLRPVDAAGASGLNEFERIEESSMRRVMDRARLLSGRTDDIESLLNGETEESASFAQALAELPRYLGGGRRPTGAFRTLGDGPPPEGAASPAPPKSPGDDEPTG